jgi:hypothetical protein
MMGTAYSLDMDKPTENDQERARETDTGEVPEKQLHRWKGEGGALPPEPDSPSGSKDDQVSGSGPEADDV